MARKILDSLALVGGLAIAAILIGLILIIRQQDTAASDHTPYDKIDRLVLLDAHPGGRFITPYIFEFCTLTEVRDGYRWGRYVRWWSNGLQETTTIECWR